MGDCKATAVRQKDGVVLLTSDTITPICYENPTINPAFQAKNYTYFYGGSSDLSESCGKVGKVNIKTGEVKNWSRDQIYTSAINFVQKPGSKVCFLCLTSTLYLREMFFIIFEVLFIILPL